MAEERKAIRKEAAAHLKALAELGVAELRVRPGRAPAGEEHAASGPPSADAPAGASGGAARSSSAGRAPVEVVRPALQEALFGGAIVPGGDGEPAARLERLRLEELGECTRCKLAQGRKTIVFGSGNASASLMFVGEGPGADEDVQGLPFVGRAGQLLTKMIEAMVVGGSKLRREEVYIANIIKCRPPGNRDPEPEEIAACEGFLFGQIEVIRPKVIIALGAFAARTLLRSKAPISSLRGRFHEYRGRLLMPTFHPAYILRNYTEETRRTVYEDLKKAAAELDRLTPQG